MMAFATTGVLLMSGTVWEAKVKGLLKAELKRRNLTYAQLVEKLAAIGVVDSEPNIRNKLARGKFTAVFLVQCLEAIGSDTVRL
ncbi:microsomal dipeptidase-like Zn-dependent dipeptidase [Sphingomonas sp. UYAg733]